MMHWENGRDGERLLNPECMDEELRQESLDYLFETRYLCKWSPQTEGFSQLYMIVNASAVHVDVGCGRARHLIQTAPRHPDTLFIGVERNNKRFQKAENRRNKMNLDNLLIVRRDVIPLISFNFPDQCVDRYDFFYPDPWPRYRHRRRRWYRHPFIIQILRTLKVNGTLCITSDRFFYVQEAAWTLTRFLKCDLSAFHRIPEESHRTNFEIKYLKQGRRLFEIRLRKLEHITVNQVRIKR